MPSPTTPLVAVAAAAPSGHGAEKYADTQQQQSAQIQALTNAVDNMRLIDTRSLSKELVSATLSERAKKFGCAPDAVGLYWRDADAMHTPAALVYLMLMRVTELFHERAPVAAHEAVFELSPELWDKC